MPKELLDQIAELLGLAAKDLAELSLDEIDALLATAFDDAVDADADLDKLEALVVARESVKAEVVAAETAEAERLAKIEELRGRVAPKAETEPEELPADDEPAADEPKDEDAPAEGVTAPADVVEEAEKVVADEVKEPVAAAPPARVALPRRRPQSHAPVPVASGPPQLHAVVAAGDIPGYSAGSNIPTWKDLGHAFSDKAEMLDVGQAAKVARMRWEYPEDRALTAASAEENSRKLARIVAPAAIAAAGGLCGPVTPSYEQEVLAVADRPVRDGLPRFGAARGGVIHVPPPLLSNVASGIDVITSDEDASSTSKPCVTVTCASPETVTISAIPACVQVGNFDRRTFPEHFEAFWTLAAAQHSRVAEGYLLDQIAAGSTNVSDGANQGGARDTLEALIRARVEFISRHRMSPTTIFRVALPFWVRDLMRADLIREAPGAPQDRLTATNAAIDAMFSAAYYSPIWYLDTATGEGEVYATQGAGALLGWQTTPKLYIFPEGTWVWLDGGMLDFGVEIRDSTLNAANDVRAMFETFENVVKMGPESLELELALCVTGTAGGLVDLACPQVS
jgi:hypothetical protein